MSKQDIQQIISDFVTNTHCLIDLRNKLRKRIISGVCYEERLAYSSALLRMFAMVYGDEAAEELKVVVDAGCASIQDVSMTKLVNSLPKKGLTKRRSLDLSYLIPMTLMYLHHMDDSIASHLAASAETMAECLVSSGTHTEDEAFETVRAVLVEELGKRL